MAATVGLVASGWILERAFEVDNPFEQIVEAIAGSPERLALALLAPAALALLAQARPRSRPSMKTIDASTFERQSIAA